MTTFSNLSGTTTPSFQIGKNGAVINQGAYTPSANNADPTYVQAKTGDLFIRNGDSVIPAIFVYENSEWIEKGDWFVNGDTTYNMGNVGIGTMSSYPGSILTIEGNVSILGNIVYADGSTQNKAPDSYAAGINGSIQFNDGTGHFAADSGITWDNTNKRLGVDAPTPSTTIQFKHVGMEAVVSNVGATLSPIVVDVIDATTFRSGHYYIQVTDTDNNIYQISQVTVLQNGTIAQASEYNLMFDNQIIGTFDAALQGADLQLIYTPSYSSNATVKVNRSTMTL